MPEPHDLYELTGDLPDLDGPVLVQAMTGFVDAGGATRLARDQLLAADGVEPVAGYEPWLQRVQVPGSAGHLLEYRLGQAGHDAMGFAVHVPHYLAQTDFPPAAEQLLASLSRTTGLLLAIEDLRTAGAEMRA